MKNVTTGSLKAGSEIMRTLLLSVVCLLVLTASPSGAEDPCLACHREKSAGVVQYWQESGHAKAGVTCVSCHGRDVEANHGRAATVSAAVCGNCHKEAALTHRAGKHGIGMKSGRGCTRNLDQTQAENKACALCHEEGSSKPKVTTECALFLAQSPSMQRQGCDACHRVENRCDTCHTKHGTDLSLAKRPETCGTCHMGPDHAQYEMWESSMHGVAYRHSGGKAGPACTTCHMKEGTHNVSRGITAGMGDASPDLRKKERAAMLDICVSCHTRPMAARNLEDADMIEKESAALVAEAQSVVQQLRDEKLLAPSEGQRPPHPLFGRQIIIGPQMLYENLSSVESGLFKMKQFHYMNAVKGAYHQNPDYTHWYGNAPLKLTLSEIKSEASLLRSMELLRKRLDNLASQAPEHPDDGLKKKLRGLMEKRLKGELSEKDFQNEKDILMKQHGL